MASRAAQPEAGRSEKGRFIHEYGCVLKMTSKPFLICAEWCNMTGAIAVAQANDRPVSSHFLLDDFFFQADPQVIIVLTIVLTYPKMQII